MSSHHIAPADLAGLLHAQLDHEGLIRSGGADTTTVQPVLNWGGFVNSSFSVSDEGRAVLHVKLADNQGSVAQLRQWQSLGEQLFVWYRAPRVLRWIDVPNTAYSGLVLEAISGVTPSALSPSQLDQTVRVIKELHADRALAEVLHPGLRVAPSFAESYLTTYHERFVEDLAAIASGPPPFVKPEVLRWMAAETAALHAEVIHSPDFREASTSPIHADLWLNNTLVQQGDFVRIVDWDDLMLGDPMLDWTMLFGPSAADLSPADLHTIERLDLSPSEAQRLALYARASLLDWIIDPLADWIEAERDPTHRDEVRQVKEETHREALERYRHTYK